MCTQNNMDNTNNIPQNIEYMCVWTPQDIFLKLSGNNFTPVKKPVNKGFSPFESPLWQQNGNII